jgi:hypothetical protein
MGWKMQPTCAVTFDRVFVPSSHLIGAVGEGFRIAMSALDGGRVNIGACSVGGGAFCLDAAFKYAAERQQFGQVRAGSEGTAAGRCRLPPSLYTLIGFSCGFQCSRVIHGPNQPTHQTHPSTPSSHNTNPTHPHKSNIHHPVRPSGPSRRPSSSWLTWRRGSRRRG